LLLLGAAAIACSLLLLNFYFYERDSLVARRDAGFREVTEAVSVLQKQNDLKQFTARIQKSVASDSSAAEGQLLHIVQDWQQRAGADGASFERVGMSKQSGFVLLTFNVSVSGNMPALAAFLYQAETASIPLRVENVQMHPKTAGGEDLQLHLQISTLYRPSAKRVAPNAADAEVARGPG
jgi:hypothetical protein